MNVMQVVPEDVTLGENRLTVVLPDGRRSYFNYYWLRDNCPTSFCAVTREWEFDIFHLSAVPKAASAVVEAGALVISWAGEEHVSRYPLDLLAVYADGGMGKDPADLPRKAWFSDHYPEMARFTYDMRSRQRVIELVEKGQVSGLTISQHMLDYLDLPQEVLDDYYPAVCRFGKMLQDDRFLMRFTLRATECIVFDNHRIVHGRAAYVAQSGERCLRGCAIPTGPRCALPTGRW